MKNDRTLIFFLCEIVFFNCISFLFMLKWRNIIDRMHMAFVAKFKPIVVEKEVTNFTVRVEVSRSLYKDPDTGYFVVLFEQIKGHAIPEITVSMNSGRKVVFQDKTFIGVGTSEQMATSIVAGQEVELQGYFEEGREKDSINMNVQNVVELMPTRPATIRAFLSSNRMKGIGPKGAEEVVKLFGPKTLKVLQETPNEFLKVRSISEKDLVKLTASWAEYQECYDCLAELRKYKISEDASIKLYKHFGAKAPELIEEDPYVATEVRGISFKTADEIAQSMGVSYKDESRVKSGVNFLVQQSNKNGNTYVNSVHLMEDALNLLGVEKTDIICAVKSLIGEGKVVQNKVEHRYLANKYTNEYQNYLVNGFSDVKSFKTEFSIAKELNRIVSAGKVSLPAFNQDDIDRYFDFNSDKLDSSQLLAAKTILSKKVAFLTGGPGTGKTHTIKSLLNFFDAMNKKRKESGDVTLSYTLCAPTGRAAKRMNESTGRESSTIHSLLGFSPEGGFTFNSQDKMSYDILIVDESSMIDIWITASLLRAVKDDAIVIFVGDADQLKSVGPGKVFQDLMSCGLFAVARLQEIHRQARNSQIILAAHNVIHNQMPKLFLEDCGVETDSVFIPASRNPDIHELIVKRVKDLLASGVRPEDIQILTPKKAGEIGVRNLNETLRPLLNPKYQMYSYLQSKFVTGDRVMQLKNRKDLGIYNGDIGVVKYFDEDNGGVVAIFDGKELVLENADLKHLDFCYACTIHKAQGSDYPQVIIPISPSDMAMWDCNLLYTAITRAKNFLTMVGDERTMKISVASFKQVDRLTGLKEAILERHTKGDELDEEMRKRFEDIEELDLEEEMEDAVF